MLATTLYRPVFLSVPVWVLRMTLDEVPMLLLGSQRLQSRRALETGYRFHFPSLEEALAGLLTQDKHLVAR